jgi:hypothetical protein
MTTPLKRRMRGSVALCLLAFMSVTAHAEQWFMVQSPVSVSVDTASIKILPSGQRRARVKHDMSLVPPDPKEPPNHPLFFITTMIFDCKKQSSRAESGEAHLADGTVTQWQRKNPQLIWLKTDDDVALAFVCAWPGPNSPGGAKRYPDD